MVDGDGPVSKGREQRELADPATDPACRIAVVDTRSAGDAALACHTGNTCYSREEEEGVAEQLVQRSQGLA